MFKRRDVLKLIASAGITLPFAETNPLLNPEKFADTLDNHLQSSFGYVSGSDEGCIYDYICPEDYQEYDDTIKAFLAKWPGMRHDPDFLKIRDAAMNWCLESYSEGVKNGAAYEYARRQIVERDS